MPSTPLVRPTATGTGIADGPDNTATWWWQDRGLRLCMANIFVLFLTPYTQGFDGILFTGLQVMPAFLTKFRPSDTELGLMAASVGFPLLGVPFLVQWLADRYGRRPLITVSCLFVIGGPLISGLGKTRGTFIGGRVLTGVGNAFVQVTAPTLIAEIAHPRFRPVVTASYQPTAFIGAVICGWIMFGVTKWNSDWAWRVPTLLQCLSFIPVLFWSVSPWMVESPRYLVYSGQKDKAHALLAKLHANGDMTDELVVNELNEIVEACDADRERGKTSSFADFVRTPGNIKRLLIILVFGFISQMSGNGIVTIYIGRMLIIAGIHDPLTLQGIICGLTMWLLISALLAAQFVERIGRRGILLWALVGMIISLSLVTAFSALVETAPRYGVGAIVLIFIFSGIYSSAFAVVPYLYLTEILPYNLRGKGLSIFAFVNAAFTIYTQYVSPIALGSIGWRYYIVFIACDVFTLVAMYFVITETRGHTLEEIQELFDGQALGRVATGATDEKGHVEEIEDK
ncbi:Lactose permease [Vanrija pseudolonga]|uniref:Lactose permease n=1 Tax=Vanrija pseudolonga TaxID=143232 RepID=A0AAF0YGK6_9TREE|nr:Lactose permease [Vanrija pseudolonga]